MQIRRSCWIAGCDPVNRQVSAKMGVHPAHGGYPHLRVNAPAVIHGLHPVDGVTAPAHVESAGHATRQVEMPAIARAKPGTGVLRRWRSIPPLQKNSC